MTQLAIESNGAFSASRIEIDRIGKSYTVETLRELTAANPETDYYFIVGMDSVPEIPSWYCWQEIVQLTRFAVLQRPGYDYETLKLTTPLELLSKITFIPTEPLDISATK